MSILIHNCTAVLMDEAGTVLPGAYVAVEGTRIVSVGTVRPQGTFDQEIDGKGNVLMPGFVNAHRSEERRVGKECRSRWSPYH